MALAHARSAAEPSRRGRRTRTGLALAATSACALLLNLVSAGTASAAVDYGSIYVNPNRDNTRECLDVRGGSLANQNAVQVWTCNGTAAQDWFVGGDGTVRLSTHRNKCLDVAGAGIAHGTPVDIYDCNGTAAQQWTYYEHWLINNHSFKCLDETNSTMGRQLIIWDCFGTWNQVWDVPNGDLHIVPPAVIEVN